MSVKNALWPLANMPPRLEIGNVVRLINGDKSINGDWFMAKHGMYKIGLEFGEYTMSGPTIPKQNGKLIGTTYVNGEITVVWENMSAYLKDNPEAFNSPVEW